MIDTPLLCFLGFGILWICMTALIKRKAYRDGRKDCPSCKARSEAAERDWKDRQLKDKIRRIVGEFLEERDQQQKAKRK